MIFSWVVSINLTKLLCHSKCCWPNLHIGAGAKFRITGFAWFVLIKKGKTLAPLQCVNITVIAISVRHCHRLMKTDQWDCPISDLEGNMNAKGMQSKHMIAINSNGIVIFFRFIQHHFPFRREKWEEEIKQKIITRIVIENGHQTFTWGLLGSTAMMVNQPRTHTSWWRK